MFSRRIKPSLKSRLWGFLWPQMGCKRTIEYWAHRISRLPGSIYSISAGIAFGAAVSFTPFVGLHLVLAALLAWIFRANILASAIGTLVGNPWTFPFIWLWIYQLGIWLGFGEIPEYLKDLHFSSLFGNILTALLNFDGIYLMKVAWPLFRPMLAGALPTSIVSWIGFYYLSKILINSIKTKYYIKYNS